MKNKKLILIGAAALSLVLLAVAAPSALSAPTATLTASVQSQACQGGDNVNVTLTATLQPPQTTSDIPGISTTTAFSIPRPAPNPTVTSSLPGRNERHGRSEGDKGTRSATDSITFSTLTCGG